MRSLTAKTRGLEEDARREQAEQSLRVTQLSTLREISRGILGQLDLAQLTTTITAQLRDALGYDEVAVHLGQAVPDGVSASTSIVCPITDDAVTLGDLVAANRAGSRPIDPRERELLEMLAESLVVAITVAPPIGTSIPAEPPSEGEATSRRRGRILLVDNDPQVMSILGEMLGDAGHHVVPVGSAEALRVFVRGGFDLVMTNIGMAGMNGWELAERIRERDPQVPLIFITGWGLQEQDQVRCRGLGVSSRLFKPVRPAELHHTVQSALAAARSATSGSAAVS